MFKTEIDGIDRPPLRTYSLDAWECDAAHCDAWWVRLVHRAIDDHRSAHQSHGARCMRIGYGQFVPQCGNWGALCFTVMSRAGTSGIAGHTNSPGTRADDVLGQYGISSAGLY